MNELLSIIAQPEGRRLEFKENLSKGYGIEQTVVAFSNGAGGEIYLGIEDKTKVIIGFSENEILTIEEKISNIIFENTSPSIVPDINIINYDSRYLLKITVYPGGQTPYFISSLGVNKGTYIRVGSSNKPADETIIQELQRKKRNVSFDAMVSQTVSVDDIDLKEFKDYFLDQTGKKITNRALETLGLIKIQDGKQFPTNSAILLSSADIKQREFPYAKIECARFDGTTTSETSDAFTIEGPLCLQPDAALKFIQRNIKKASKIKGVHREEHWEYPLKAIREIIVNAVIHRDYSRPGSDIKVAIFDDMLEVTSPGSLPATIDINNLSSGLSEIRNRTLAPIFKMINLIEQWGTGFQKIADELKIYPEIEVKYLEPGLSFQVQFIKKSIDSKSEKNAVDNQGPSMEQAGTKLGLSWDYVGTKLGISKNDIKKILAQCRKAKSLNEIMLTFKFSNKSKFREKYINPFVELGLLELTILGKPKSPNQKYHTTSEGDIFLNTL